MPIPPRFRPVAPAAIVLASLIVLSPIACAPATSGAGSADMSRAGRPSDVISEKELADPAFADKTLLDVIQRLRPRFLNSRSSTVREGNSEVRVSLDGASPESVDALAHIFAPEVSEIRLLSVGDANLRFGMQGTGGPVILVTTKRH